MYACRYVCIYGRMPRSSEDETSEPIGKLQAAENSIFASRWERFTPYIADALLQCVSLSGS